ncbi:response regulator transcription factor [Actinomyces sp. 432]|uniref:response regulator transcription factor n=1 Tax=Actinomyces sp. 432 TaxID=2057798 RepID=UPI001F27BDE3|nr:response regulator transcription factor [Actinomyces sp. 432]
MRPSTAPRINQTGRVITVMVVDDQRAAHMGLSLIINRAEDLQVIAQATDGQDALDQLTHLETDRRSLPDVVLMDIRMPVLNGVEAIARISQLHPSVKTLALTTYDQDDYAFGALSAGASGFLLKDTRTAQLHQAIRAVASGDAVLTPRITRELLRRHAFRPVASPQQRAAQERLERLSPREREVAELVAQGLTNSEIAQRLVIATDSVKKNVTRILAKLDLRDRVQLVILMRDIESQ